MKDEEFEEFTKQLTDLVAPATGIMESLMDAAIRLAPKVAEFHQALYVALRERGFSEDQAVQITTNYKMELGKS